MYDSLTVYQATKRQRVRAVTEASVLDCGTAVSLMATVAMAAPVGMNVVKASHMCRIRSWCDVLCDHDTTQVQRSLQMMPQLQTHPNAYCRQAEPWVGILEYVQGTHACMHYGNSSRAPQCWNFAVHVHINPHQLQLPACAVQHTCVATSCKCCCQVLSPPLAFLIP